METRLFHIFRNTPLGRETLLQSLYFCQKMGTSLLIYIPQHTKFLMYFENDVVQVDLDSSYLTAPHSARRHAEELAEGCGIVPSFFEPKHFTASTLPDIPTHFEFMCCPRSISDLHSKIGLGYIGPRVRRIVKSARFPVLMTSGAHKEWQRVAVFFGGSANAVKALRLGLRIGQKTGCPLDVFTQVEKGDEKDYRAAVASAGLEAAVADRVQRWRFFKEGGFEENLYEVPHDALLIVGAFGHGVIRDVVFGSMMEKIQSIMPNNFLIAGPHYTAGS
ncbi:MAG: universal stress protein [Desulfobacteraceae bacterium]|jgi:antitoxin component of MazEF toxin-antitoxin module